MAEGAPVGADGDRQRLTETQQHERRRMMPALFSQTPFLATLGLVVEGYQPDEVSTRLPFRHDLTNDGRTFHGGVLATVLDTTAALAAWSNHDFDRGTRAATVSLSVQYLSGSDGTDLLCRAVTVRRARELVFSEATATDPSGKVLAHALQTYRIA